MALPSAPRSTIRTHILSVLRSASVPHRSSRQMTSRTPEAVRAGEINPLRKLDKTLDVVPKVSKGKFNG